MKIILEDLKRILSDSISLSKSGVKLYPRFLFLSVVFLFSYVIVFLIDQTVRDFFSKIHTNYFDFIFNVGHFYGKLYLTLIFFFFFFFFRFPPAMLQLHLPSAPSLQVSLKTNIGRYSVTL